MGWRGPLAVRNKVRGRAPRVRGEMAEAGEQALKADGMDL